MADNTPIKVLVVDDTAFYRRAVADVLSEIPEAMVVGTAGNGKIAVSRIKTLKPDLLTLDIEMPEMNGLEVLRWVKANAPEVGAVVLSSLTTKGGEMTMQALDLGAFDFIPKAEASSLSESKAEVKRQLVPIIRNFKRQQGVFRLLRSARAQKQGLKKNDIHTSKPAVPTSAGPVIRPSGVVRPALRSEIVAIGISTGGPNALTHVIPKLPADFPVPLLIVQHMPPVFTDSLAKSLNAKSKVTVREARDGEPIKPGLVLIAPGGKQMKLVAAADGRNRLIKITNDPPENSCRPSADYLFRSVAQYYMGRATGVIMTGMGSDGTLGLKLMKRNGSHIIAQDEASCTVYGMPKEPTEQGIVDVVAPLDKIADEILRSVR